MIADPTRALHKPPAQAHHSWRGMGRVTSSSAAAASKRFGTLKAPPTMHGELARLEAQLARLLSIKNRHA